MHYIGIDFGRNIQVRRDALELLGDPPAKVLFTTDGQVRISFAE